MIAIDFETHLISEEHPYPKPVCLSYYRGIGTEEVGLLVGDDIPKLLKSVLENETFIAHNAGFECLVIYKWYPELRELLKTALEKGKVVCTKVNQQMMDLQEKTRCGSYSLASLIKHYFQEDISATKTEDSWRLRYSELEDVPLKDWPKEAVEYAVDDSIWAFKVYQAQKMMNIKAIVEAEFYLNKMGAYGIHIDRDRVDMLEEEIYKILEPRYKYLIEQGILTPKEGSRRPKVESKIFKEYIVKNIPEVLYTPKGNVRHDHEALLAYLTNSENKVLQSYLDIVKYDKVLTAFVSRLKGATKIRSQYSGIVSTGRTSSFTSSIYPSVNIQQMPRAVEGMTWDVRNCFIPRKGHQIVSIDYTGLELASTAHQLHKFYKKSKLCDTINSGDAPMDLHCNFAKEIATIKWGRKVTYEEFLQNKKEPAYKEFRQMAKPINLGFPGGIGYDTMRKLLLQSGVKTGFTVLETNPNPYTLKHALKQLKWDYPNLRLARLSKDSWAIVEDELVGLKRTLFRLYPELELFLKDSHTHFIDGDNFTWTKNEYGEWEKEPAYMYNIYGIARKWCTYTSFCNGFLMQTPSAIGAKKMVCDVSKRFAKEINMLAFIHDEIIFEIVDNSEKYAIIKEVGYQMIESMQSVLSSVRISVEASLMNYWSKNDELWSDQYFKSPARKA